MTETIPKLKLKPIHVIGILAGLALLSKGDDIRRSIEHGQISAAIQASQSDINQRLKDTDKRARAGSRNAINTRVRAGAVPVAQVWEGKPAIDLDGLAVRDELFVMDAQGNTAIVRQGRMWELLKIQEADMEEFAVLYRAAVDRRTPQQSI